MHSLRSRLILSHILPLLIIIPLIGIALIYILETQVILPNLSNELARQAGLTAEIAGDHPDIWTDAGQAQDFVNRFSAHYQSKVMLLDAQGEVLASSLPDDQDSSGKPVEIPNLPRALAGENSVQINYSQSLHTEIAEVLAPVVGPDGQVVGVIRLTHQLASVQGQFWQLRYLIAGVLVVELVLGAMVGLVLALDLERSLRRVTQAIYDVASGRQWMTLPEQGPDEIRLLLRAFNTLIERLRLLEEARRRLLANLVHEVGRPVGALQSAIQALLNGADQEAALRQELLEGMEAEVERMHPLLDNLAKLHDQVLGTLELNHRPVALSEWLSRTAGPWREAAQAKGLQWEVDIPAALPMVDIDPDRLGQALGNLLSNAIKYTPGGGAVALASSIEDHSLWIRVSDTGPGISPDEQGRIFEPFYRSRSGHRFPDGMGLGLTIARDLVIAHNGHLEVESQPGQGSRFTICLPPQVILPT
jgi:signal transduction histidine kinase